MTVSKGALLASLLLAVAACGKASVPPVDDTASDAGALPDPAPSPPPAQSLALPGRLRAVGTEPFWSAEIDGAALTYRTPEFPNGIHITISARAARDSVEYVGTLDGKPLSLTVTPGQCSDGMSDIIYPYAAVREIGPEIARGCAR